MNTVNVSPGGSYGFTYRSAGQYYDLPVNNNISNYKTFDSAGNIVKDAQGQDVVNPGNVWLYPQLNGQTVRLPRKQTVKLEFFLNGTVTYRKESIYASYQDPSTNTVKQGWVVVNMPLQTGYLKITAQQYSLSGTSGVIATNGTPILASFTLRGFDSSADTNASFLWRKELWYRTPQSVSTSTVPQPQALFDWLDTRSDTVSGWKVYNQGLGRASVSSTGTISTVTDQQGLADWNLGIPSSTNANNCISKTIQVNADQQTFGFATGVSTVPPVVNTPTISLSNPVSSIGSSTHFSVDTSDADVQSVQWTFSDGSTASGGDVDHTFVLPGLYTANVTVTTSTGQTVQASQQVAVLKAMKDIPVTRSLSNSMTATFDAGDALPGFDYTWTFGDGTSGSGSRTTHTYPQIGTFDFYLSVRDTRVSSQAVGHNVQALSTNPDANLVFKGGSWITVWRKSPIARLSIQTPNSPLNVAAGNFPFTADFDASTSSDQNTPLPSQLTYSWNFGDGTVLTDAGPIQHHQYNVEGRFPLTLTVKNQFGLSDIYRSFVYSHDIRANIKINTAYRTTGIQSLSLNSDPVISPLLSTQSTISTYIDYFPYVLHKSYTFLNGNAYSLSSTGSRVTSFCGSIEAYSNGGPALPSSKYQTDYSDPNATFCNGLGLALNAFKFSGDKPINELLVSNDRYLNAARASVFTGLVVPRVNISVYPDEFLPGDQASPILTESTYNNPTTGKTEWMINVRIRESEMQSDFASGAQLRFKVPVMAVDSKGNFMPTVNGRFDAVFAATNFASACGDCVMVDGRSSIAVTMPANQFTLTQPALDLSTISLGNDSADHCGSVNSNGIYGRYGISGCVLIGTSNVYPAGIASGPSTYQYPIGDPAKFFGHVVYGDTADSVRRFREYMSEGIYSDMKDMILNFVPFAGSSIGFMDAVKAYKAQGPSVGNVAMIVLAGGGFVADAFPLVGKTYEAFFKSVRASQAGAKGFAKALDGVVEDGSKGFGQIKTDLEDKLGSVNSEMNTCGKPCVDYVDYEAKFDFPANSDNLSLYTQMNQKLKDGKMDDIDTMSRLTLAEISVLCPANTQIGTLAVRTGPYVCMDTFVDFVKDYKSAQKRYNPKLSNDVDQAFRGQLQGHHALQQEWAVQCLKPSNYPNMIQSLAYDPDLAPVVMLETNKDAGFNGKSLGLPTEPKLPHSLISAAQVKRNTGKAGSGWCSSTLRDELALAVKDLSLANMKPADIKCALIFNYDMLIKLGLKLNQDFFAVAVDGDVTYEASQPTRDACYARVKVL
ncbi:PKD domain-containing protein [Deinococcus ruber]|uniref:PKD domain-containing protein n=1 Tax=Deinococcus ruber TaxID=1848197 RepID=UPI0016656E4A|nr:PKD domain-containing protein [Deinococcus ruber]